MLESIRRVVARCYGVPGLQGYPQNCAPGPLQVVDAGARSIQAADAAENIRRL